MADASAATSAIGTLNDNVNNQVAAKFTVAMIEADNIESCKTKIEDDTKTDCDAAKQAATDLAQAATDFSGMSF